MLETIAKSSDNKSAINEDNAFAETMNLETVRSERNVVPGKRFYSEAVKRRNNENYERSKPWENQPVERISKPTISIVGDSLLRNVRKRAFNREIRQFSSYV